MLQPINESVGSMPTFHICKIKSYSSKRMQQLTTGVKQCEIATKRKSPEQDHASDIFVNDSLVTFTKFVILES